MLRRSGFDWEVLPHAGIALGTIKTHANLGAEIRFGLNLPDDFGTGSIDSSASTSTPVDGDQAARRSRFDLDAYLFARVDGRAVARNIFLDGNTFSAVKRIRGDLLIVLPRIRTPTYHRIHIKSELTRCSHMSLSSEHASRHGGTPSNHQTPGLKCRLSMVASHAPWRTRATSGCRNLRAFLILLLAWTSAGSLGAQTAWSIHPDAPPNVPAAAKLKYANDSIRLMWQTDSYYPAAVFQMDLRDAHDIPQPYTLPVGPNTLGVDPAPGSTKRLTIRYATSTGEYVSSVQDGFTLAIPGSSRTLVGPPQPVNGFVVISATYGTTTLVTDVKHVFHTTRISLPPYGDDFTLSDFTYDGSGNLLLIGDSYGPAIAYPYYEGYLVDRPSGGHGWYSSNAKTSGTWGNGRVVIGHSDPSYENIAPLFSFSTTGTYPSWSSPTLAPGYAVNQIIHEAGRIVAVGARYDDPYSPASKGAVLISSDGLEWITLVIDGTTTLEAVGHDAGQWVAVGDSGLVVTSPNGFEWTKTSIPGAGNLISVACGNGYCVVGSSSGKIYTTTDFSTWTEQLVVNGPLRDLAVGDGQFVALGGSQVYQAAFSPLGIADVTSHPASAFTIPGQSVTLSVEATGTGTLSYQWYEGESGDTSQPVSLATEFTFQTPSLFETTRYWVRVSNEIGSEDSITATLTMQAPPAITAQPANKTFTMGSTVSTSIDVTGNNISYQWYQGFSGDVSTPLAGKTTASLTLPAQEWGVRYYWVRVSNALGFMDSATLRAEVIPVAPVIASEPLDTQTFQGNYMSISVSANGPLLKYQWYAGVSGDTSHPVAGTSSFFAPPYRTVGIYQYWVRVSNPVGAVDSRTVLFSVLTSLEPIITRQPFDSATYVGTSKSVNVTASGNSLSYAWYAGESGDTSIIVSDSSSNYTPSNTVPGYYRFWARVSNPAGFVDSTAFTYLVKPLASGLITKHPLDSTTQINTWISLSVTATGTDLTYQWYAGLSGDTSTPLSGRTSSSYSPPVTTVGQQPYWVRVTSGTTVADSETAVLTVVPSILVITGQPLDRSVYVNSNIYHYVYTNGSNVAYQWYSGMSGDTSVPLSGKTSSSFSPPTSAAGEFQYWMRATSGLDHVDSRTTTVTVIGRSPVITTQPQDRNFSAGTGSMSINASLAFSSGVTWQWYQGISGDTAAPLSNQTSTTLSLSDLPAGNYLYWVRATNLYGNADSRTASVTVTPSQYAGWLLQHGLPADGSGIGAPDASPYQDGVANLLKYVLGMAASDRFDDVNGPKSSIRNIGGHRYLTLEFVQLLGSQDVDLVVEESTTLDTWTIAPVECGPSYDNGDGTMTRTFRGSQPMNSQTSGFLRLKAISN